MIRGIGIDILSVTRMEKPLQNEWFYKRVFTPAEMARINSKGKLAVMSAAGIFCAKEAFSKAVGTGLSRNLFSELEIGVKESGEPYFILSGNLAERYGEYNFYLSITHEKEIAAAVAVMEE